MNLPCELVNGDKILVYDKETKSNVWGFFMSFRNNSKSILYYKWGDERCHRECGIFKLREIWKNCKSYKIKKQYIIKS